VLAEPVPPVPAPWTILQFLGTALQPPRSEQKDLAAATAAAAAEECLVKL